MKLRIAMSVLALGSSLHAAPSTQPIIALKSDVEEGKKMLVATVTLGDKPVEDAAVKFFARRTFGSLSIGTEKTLDDGTAAVPFPSDLPGGSSGKLDLVAEITQTETIAAARVESAFLGGKIVPHIQEQLPRALWAPNAPMTLIAGILTLMTGVWVTYLYVVLQLIKLKKGAV